MRTYNSVAWRMSGKFQRTYNSVAWRMSGKFQRTYSNVAWRMSGKFQRTYIAWHDAWVESSRELRVATEKRSMSFLRKFTWTLLHAPPHPTPPPRIDGPFIEGLPINSMVIFHGYVSHNQRVKSNKTWKIRLQWRLPKARTPASSTPWAPRKSWLASSMAMENKAGKPSWQQDETGKKRCGWICLCFFLI